MISPESGGNLATDKVKWSSFNIPVTANYNHNDTEFCLNSLKFDVKFVREKIKKNLNLSAESVIAASVNDLVSDSEAQRKKLWSILSQDGETDQKALFQYFYNEVENSVTSSGAFNLSRFETLLGQEQSRVQNSGTQGFLTVLKNKLESLAHEIYAETKEAQTAHHKDSDMRVSKTQTPSTKVNLGELKLKLIHFTIACGITSLATLDRVLTVSISQFLTEAERALFQQRVNEVYYLSSSSNGGSELETSDSKGSKQTGSGGYSSSDNNSPKKTSKAAGKMEKKKSKLKKEKDKSKSKSRDAAASSPGRNSNYLLDALINGPVNTNGPASALDSKEPKDSLIRSSSRPSEKSLQSMESLSVSRISKERTGAQSKKVAEKDLKEEESQSEEGEMQLDDDDDEEE